MLKQDINNYLSWMIAKGYAYSTRVRYKRVLMHFLSYVSKRDVPENFAFAATTLMGFKKHSGLIHRVAINGLCRYLLGRQKPKLPVLYERYLEFYRNSRQVQPHQIKRARRVLIALNDYLLKEKIKIGSIKIEQVDAFLAQYNVLYTPVVCQSNRSCLRGFFRYLYQEKIIHRNLAPLLPSACFFAQVKPPRFLRPKEVKKLFYHPKLSSPKQIRTYAMLHIAFTLGLRPKEVSLIELDHIGFKKGEISLKNRKSKNPIKLPLPENTIKAIAAYILGARPKSKERALFLNLNPPHSPISPALVSHDIAELMKKRNLPSSAYWLRHTYAQNLLEAGVSTYEIKEMLGHDRIQTTKRYIHINHKLMRKVLFDETL